MFFITILYPLTIVIAYLIFCPVFGGNYKYPIYKSGEDYYIGEHKVPAGTDIEDEIRSLYGAEVIGPEMPHPMHEETKFRKL
jgi:hypothetical protein